MRVKSAKKLEKEKSSSANKNCQNIKKISIGF